MVLFDNAEFECAPKARRYAKMIAAKIQDDFQAKRVYVSVLCLDALADYLYSEGMNVNISKNIYKILSVNEEFEITDLHYNGRYIDIRVTVGDKYFLIPKTHIKYGITPDLYAIASYDKNTGKIRFVGCLDPKKIDKQRQNDKYYIMDISQTEPPLEIEDRLKIFKPEKMTEMSHDLFSSLFIDYTDGILSEDNKRRLIRHLIECRDCRESFAEFYDYEIIVKETSKYPEVLEDHTLNIVGAEAVNDEKYKDYKEITYEIEKEPDEYEEDEVKENKVSDEDDPLKILYGDGSVSRKSVFDIIGVPPEKPLPIINEVNHEPPPKISDKGSINPKYYSEDLPEGIINIKEEPSFKQDIVSPEVMIIPDEPAEDLPEFAKELHSKPISMSYNDESLLLNQPVSLDQPGFTKPRALQRKQAIEENEYDNLIIIDDEPDIDIPTIKQVSDTDLKEEILLSNQNVLNEEFKPAEKKPVIPEEPIYEQSAIPEEPVFLENDIEDEVYQNSNLEEKISEVKPSEQLTSFEERYNAAALESGRSENVSDDIIDDGEYDEPEVNEDELLHFNIEDVDLTDEYENRYVIDEEPLSDTKTAVETEMIIPEEDDTPVISSISSNMSTSETSEKMQDHHPTERFRRPDTNPLRENAVMPIRHTDSDNDTFVDPIPEITSLSRDNDAGMAASSLLDYTEEEPEPIILSSDDITYHGDDTNLARPHAHRRNVAADNNRVMQELSSMYAPNNKFNDDSSESEDESDEIILLDEIPEMHPTKLSSKYNLEEDSPVEVPDAEPDQLEAKLTLREEITDFKESSDNSVEEEPIILPVQSEDEEDDELILLDDIPNAGEKTFSDENKNAIGIIPEKKHFYEEEDNIPVENSMLADEIMQMRDSDNKVLPDIEPETEEEDEDDELILLNDIPGVHGRKPDDEGSFIASSRTSTIQGAYTNDDDMLIIDDDEEEEDDDNIPMSATVSPEESYPIENLPEVPSIEPVDDDYLYYDGDDISSVNTPYQTQQYSQPVQPISEPIPQKDYSLDYIDELPDLGTFNETPVEPLIDFGSVEDKLQSTDGIRNADSEMNDFIRPGSVIMSADDDEDDEDDTIHIIDDNNEPSSLIPNKTTASSVDDMIVIDDEDDEDEENSFIRPASLSDSTPSVLPSVDNTEDDDMIVISDNEETDKDENSFIRPASLAAPDVTAINSSENAETDGMIIISDNEEDEDNSFIAVAPAPSSSRSLPGDISDDDLPDVPVNAATVADTQPAPAPSSSRSLLGDISDDDLPDVPVNAATVADTQPTPAPSSSRSLLGDISDDDLPDVPVNTATVADTQPAATPSSMSMLGDILQDKPEENTQLSAANPASEISDDNSSAAGDSEYEIIESSEQEDGDALSDSDLDELDAMDEDIEPDTEDKVEEKNEPEDFMPGEDIIPDASSEPQKSKEVKYDENGFEITDESTQPLNNTKSTSSLTRHYPVDALEAKEIHEEELRLQREEEERLRKIEEELRRQKEEEEDYEDEEEDENKPSLVARAAALLNFGKSKNKDEEESEEEDTDEEEAVDSDTENSEEDSDEDETEENDEDEEETEKEGGKSKVKIILISLVTLIALTSFAFIGYKIYSGFAKEKVQTAEQAEGMTDAIPALEEEGAIVGGEDIPAGETVVPEGTPETVLTDTTENPGLLTGETPVPADQNKPAVKNEPEEKPLPAPPKPETVKKPVAADAQPKDMNKAMTNVFADNPTGVTVTKTSWMVARHLSADPAVVKFLQTTGRNIQTDLKRNLKAVQGNTYEENIKVNIVLSKEVGCESVTVAKSSGSKQIDDIVLQSVKETLAPVPFPELSETTIRAGEKTGGGNKVKMTLSVNF